MNIQHSACLHSMYTYFLARGLRNSLIRRKARRVILVFKKIHYFLYNKCIFTL